MIDPKIVKFFTILVTCGAVGSILALIPLLFQRSEKKGYGTTAGVGFLIGAAVGSLFGIFSLLLNQI